ncbi:MAG: glycoside hydrolase family 125 protein [Firmicutes bacterium]|nr:glycoside hydrolase family 125 protein [Bacillota bacterium]
MPRESNEATQRLMTVPREIDNPASYLPTGNEYLSIPTLNPHNGGIQSINILHMASRGLIEFCGKNRDDLFLPTLWVEGEEHDLAGKLRWDREGHWVPRFGCKESQLEIQGTVCAPVGFKGFMYVLEISRAAAGPAPANAVSTNGGAMGNAAAGHASSGNAAGAKPGQRIFVGMRGSWVESRRTIYTSKRIHARHCAWYNKWTQGLTLELRPDVGIAALAISASEELDTCIWGLGQGLANREVSCQNNGTDRINFILGKEYNLAPGERVALAFYVAVNVEGDGAGTNLFDMKRHGWEKLLAQTRAWLASHALAAPAGLSPAFARLLNLNLFFSYFYAHGRAIDTEETVLATSRSPLYYVSAAFWPRDSFLWSFPAVLMTDRVLAREMLFIGFTRHLRNAGIHSHYIDGVLLYPGFELDQLAAYLVALGEYLEATGDFDLLNEPGMARGVAVLEKALWDHKHPSEYLFDTFLDPSDDPVRYPYLTYDNVLVWRALRVLSMIHERVGLIQKSLAAEEAARRLREAIYRYCVVEEPFGRMFAWSVDLAGGFELYDDPPGSLMLLPHYGFCDGADEIYLNTARWIHSGENPYYHRDGRFPAAMSAHAPHPWPMALCNDLLALQAAGSGPLAGVVPDPLPLLLNLEMDSGIACETVDAQSGRVKTGAAFATAAGFLAFALARALR